VFVRYSIFIFIFIYFIIWRIVIKCLRESVVVAAAVSVLVSDNQ